LNADLEHVVQEELQEGGGADIDRSLRVPSKYDTTLHALEEQVDHDGGDGLAVPSDPARDQFLHNLPRAAGEHVLRTAGATGPAGVALREQSLPIPNRALVSHFLLSGILLLGLQRAQPFRRPPHH
jgi:hypothetical protein